MSPFLIIMEISLLQQPDSAIARVLLNNEEELTAQAGAMISMSNYVEVTTAMRRGSQKGIMAGLQRLIGGESLFLNTFKATSNHCEVILAPPLLGDLLVYDLTNYKLVVQAGSFLACTSEVNLFLGFKGFKSLLAQESLFWLSLAGKGKVIIHSFGAIYEVMVDGDYIVDTSHLVAFENSLDFKITKLNKSWLGSFASGEGLVCRFHGQGRVFCQTHHPQRWGKLLGNKISKR